MLINVCLPFQCRRQKALLNRFGLRQSEGANLQRSSVYTGLAHSAIINHHRRGALNDRSLFSHSSRVWNLSSRCQQGQFLVSSLILDCRGLASHCVLAWPGSGEGTGVLSDVSSYPGTYSHHMISSKPIISQRPPRRIPSQ